mgnify:CR=1 FL=1
MEKCECYIHSLKQGETHVLGEATIIKRLGDNDYLAEYNGVKCHAIFNPFAGRYFVDDVYGVSAIRPTGTADNRTIRHTGQAASGGLPLLCLKGGILF